MDIGWRIAEAMGLSVRGMRTLDGGKIGSVHAVTLEDGLKVVVKTSEGVPLSVEAFMLRYLQEEAELPVLDVFYADDALLVLEMLPGEPDASPVAEVHAADLLAGLHGIEAARFGFERDTLIGPFRQPNAWSADWPSFFAGRRLRYMVDLAGGRGALPINDHETT